MTSRFADHVLFDVFASRPAANAVPTSALFSATDTGVIYQSDGSAVWSVYAICLPSGGSTGQVLTKVSSTDYDVTWATPSGGGGGSALYVVDETFPGSALPAGWVYTGSGTCVVSGGKAAFVAGATTDRLMFAWADVGKLFCIRMHLKNVSTLGGMPALVALNVAGSGGGVSPYNDGNTYGWNVTTYAYGSTNRLATSNPSMTDIWLELMVNGGEPCGAGISTDGVNWTAVALNPNTPRTITQVGICALNGVTAAEVWEVTITEP